jgi:hypothetical protein
MELEILKNTIFEIRGNRVMLDFHLAELYEVEVKRLNEQVKRNIERFPKDFMFQLNENEVLNLRSQFATANFDMRRSLPYAFTEQGIAMLSGILRSRKAVQVNIEIMRAFVHLRKMALQYSEISDRIENLESKYDTQFAEVFTALRYVLDPERKEKKPNRIGYKK